MQRDIVFDLLRKAMAPQSDATDFKVLTSTQAHIVTTLTCYLSCSRKNDQEHHPDFIDFIKQAIWPLTFVSSAHLRAAACDLFFELYDQGLLELREAIIRLVSM